MFYFPPLTGVCRHLVILNVLFFIGAFVLFGPESYSSSEYVSLGRMQLAAFFPGSPNFHPYQIFTHMFMHGDLWHLFFNMLMLYIFGGAVEQYMGAKRFLTYYILCGLGAYLLFLGVEYYQLSRAGIDAMTTSRSMLGASGAIFGIYAAYGILFAEREIFLLFPPIPIKGKYLVLAFILLELYRGLSRSNSGVAHFAHVGGALAGMLLLLIWYGNRSKRWG